jgi:S-methylmethionine-dependent homocysteine/selenocysteine methylase
MLNELLHQKPLVVLDGAMGTELQRRGLDTGLPLWSANALMSKPDQVLQIHRDYIAAGADIITTNTFRTTRRTMRRANLPDRSKQLTRIAVELALQARDECRDRKVLVAGSIAPLEDCYRPDLVPPDDELHDEHAELSGRLVETGVDFLLLETMNTAREAYAASEEAVKTGKEVVVSFVCDKNGDLLSGDSLAEAVKGIAVLQPAAFSINCVSPRYIQRGIDALRSAIGTLRSLAPPERPKVKFSRAGEIPFAVYGNVGLPESDLHGWEFTHDITADDYASHARQWARMGAAIVGGCCGTTPEYISAIRQNLPQRHKDTK